MIAIQNARLFHETQEALERQTATSEVLQVIGRSITDVQPVFDIIAERAARLTGADSGFVFRYDGSLIHITSTYGIREEGVAAARRAFPMPPGEGSITAQAVRDGRVTQTADALAAARRGVLDQGRRARDRLPRRAQRADAARRAGDRRDLGHARALRRVRRPRRSSCCRPSPRRRVIAIENVRLFNETQEALEHQTATAEVLQVISSSVADTAPVFDKILASCQHLFAGHTVGMTLIREDGLLDVVANAGPGLDALKRVFPQPLTRDTSSGLAILDRQVLAYADVDDGSMPPASRDGAHALGVGAMAFAPMLFEGRGIGTLWVGRKAKEAFGAKQLGLLKTFADQAVIAIQNARMFKETNEALEQQKAAAEILNVISTSVADTQPVFDKIVDSGQHLFQGDAVSLFVVDDEARVQLRAHHGAWASVIAGNYPRPIAQTSFPQVSQERRVLVFPSAIESPEVPASIRRIGAQLGDVSVLVAAMRWRERAIGAVTVIRRPPAPFSAKEQALLQTFADQAVIAIQNARLFNETQEALETQTATADVLRVISQSPDDVQPVFDVIAERAKLLCGAWSVPCRDSTASWCTWWPTRRFAAGRRPGAIALPDDSRAPHRSPDARSWRAAGADRGHRDRGGLRVAAGTRPRGPPATAATCRCRCCTDGADGRRDHRLPRRGRPVPPTTRSGLLQTFADQAVIAIENVRLFNETQEALEQQTATAEILKVISQFADRRAAGVRCHDRARSDAVRRAPGAGVSLRRSADPDGGNSRLGAEWLSRGAQGIFRDRPATTRSPAG